MSERAQRIAATCECGDASCDATVELSVEAYRRVREDVRRFVPLPDHERPDVERVIERHDGHVIVEKVGEGARAVE